MPEKPDRPAPIPASYYQSEDVLALARSLLGKRLCTLLPGGVLSSGYIVETEAYRGAVDKASHAYNLRRTKRTEVMYAAGGLAYVYLNYGIHHLFNVVTAPAELPHAVLVRGLEPDEGLEYMLHRRKMDALKPALTAGPGRLSQALGISTSMTGYSLQGPEVWIEPGRDYTDDEILAGPRVGVAYAEEDALLPYRFSVKGNPYVSPAKGGIPPKKKR